MPRIHLPVFTDRSAISSNAGSGASVMSAGRSWVSVRQARVGRPLTTMPQLPQMPARHTKSKASEESSCSRISFRAMNSVMPAASSSSKTSVCGTLAGSRGLWRSTWKRSLRGVSVAAGTGVGSAHGIFSSMRSLRPRNCSGSRCS